MERTRGLCLACGLGLPRLGYTPPPHTKAGGRFPPGNANTNERLNDGTRRFVVPSRVPRKTKGLTQSPIMSNLLF